MPGKNKKRATPTKGLMPRKKKSRATPVKEGDAWVHPRLADLLFGRVKQEETGRTRDSRYLDIAAEALDKPPAKKPRPKRDLGKNSA